MLKIKDEVDLKELEKFGFKIGKELAKEKEFESILGEIGYEYMANWYHKCETPLIEDEWGDKVTRTHIHIKDDTRSIYIDLLNNDCTYHNSGDEIEFIENTLYDLITADLVEKVEDE